jgi:glycosyltransferase involved in cell wall biosynthesis
MVKALKVGFITYVFPTGEGVQTGSTAYAKAFVKYLARRREIEEVRVLSVGWWNYPTLETIGEKIKVYRIPCSILPRFGIDRYEYVIKSLAFTKLFKDVDIIHCEHCLEGIFGHYCKKKYGIPFILVREVVSRYLPSIFSKYFLFNIEKFLTKHLNYDILVSWSKYMVDNYFLKWGIPEKKIRIIPGGIDTEIFNPFRKFRNIRKDYNIDGDEFLLLSVKIFSLSNTLGLLNAIKAFAQFLNQKPKAKYIIVGDGKGRIYLENLIKKLKLEKEVILTGAIDSKELINYYRSSNATMHFFSYDPSISISMLESLACGAPIIATNTGEVPNIFPNDVGIIIDPKIKKFAEAIEILYENKNMRNKMAKNAWHLVKKRLNMKVIVEQYVKLYKELLKMNNC